MTLNAEWLHRVNRWREELPRHFYEPLGEAQVVGFRTFEQLTMEEALQRSTIQMPVGTPLRRKEDIARLQQTFMPMVQGTPWGSKWEYAWFKGEVVLPDVAAGKRIVLKVEVGGEGVVFVNGVAAGGRDFGHTEIVLTKKGKPGEKFIFVIESYGGHGDTPEGGGPVAFGRESVPEPPTTQRTVGLTTYGIWNEDAYQLWLDVETLFSLRNNLEPNSLRVAEIDKGLRQFTEIVDFEVPPDEMSKTFQAASTMLKPLLELHNGPTTPEFFTFGHAHLDVAWLWPLQETERKIARTISSQLALMDEYPDYKYLQSQAHLYWLLKRRYPEIYARVKQAIKAGKIIVEGGMWVEADTNLSGGESLIRQFMYGKAFFQQEFGVDNELLWLPDVFGYSGAMPQIMKGCGINYFSTAKIFWTYHGGDPFPYTLFTWEGIDGSQVLASIIYGYGNETQPGALIQTWNSRVQKDDVATQIYAFGYGDGGGGPNRQHMEFLRREMDLEGTPRVRFASPVAFFKDAEKRGVPKTRSVGELYFQNHRGTYTSQARTKRNNRHSELALRDAELWGVAAMALKDAKFPAPALHEAWQTVLLLQFHDVIPGSSIHRVYEEAQAMHAEVIQIAQDAAVAAQKKLTAAGEAVTVFNSLGWKRSALVPLPQEFGIAADLQGKPLPTQTVEDKLFALVDVPAMGWTTVAARLTNRANKTTKVVKVEKDVAVSPQYLENNILRVEFNHSGEITRIYDKESGQEFAAGPCNSFKMYKDVPSWFDAWDLDSMYADMPVELESGASVTVLSQGALFGRLRITRKLNHSALVQDVTLRKDSRMVEFNTRIDWQESHKLLKVAFATSLHSDEAIHEIQFGYIRRPTHASRQFDADRFEVSNHKWSALVEENRGFAVLNNAKFGLNVKDNCINLTLLKSALSPDMTADKGEQLVSYAFYVWNGSLFNSGVVQRAYELNVPASLVEGSGGETSLFNLDASNVIIETVKAAEDASGDVILRLYESMRSATHCTLNTCLAVKTVSQTNMLEALEQTLACQDGKIVLDFRPFEIKTLRLALNK